MRTETRTETQPENLKRIRAGDKASREHWTRIYNRFFSSETIQHGTRPETLRRSEKARQHDSGILKPSSARTETGTERKPVKPGRPPKALKGIYSHDNAGTLEEYHSRLLQP